MAMFKNEKEFERAINEATEVIHKTLADKTLPTPISAMITLFEGLEEEYNDVSLLSKRADMLPAMVILLVDEINRLRKSNTQLANLVADAVDAFESTKVVERH